METRNKQKPISFGRKIERIRKLRGMTQDDLAAGLGISKQAVSKLEQSEHIDESRLMHAAEILGVTLDGLKNYDEDAILVSYHTNFYEGSHSINTNVGTIINNPIEKIIELYENLLKLEREKVEILLKKGE